MTRKFYIKPDILVESFDLDEGMLAASGSDDHYIPVVPGQDEGAKTFNFVGMSSDDENNTYGF